MITPPSTSPIDPGRIGKLVRLLSSDQPGEAGAAAALNKTLQASDKDIHYLADVLEHALPRQAQHMPLFPSAAIARRRSPRGSPLKVGDRVVCHEESSVFRARRCGSSRFTVAPGVGPHLAQLVSKDAAPMHDAIEAVSGILTNKQFEALRPVLATAALREVITAAEQIISSLQSKQENAA